MLTPKLQHRRYGLPIAFFIELLQGAVNRSEQTIKNYVRGIRGLMNFHSILPEELDIDQVIDFLNDFQIEKERNWRTIKIHEIPNK